MAKQRGTLKLEGSIDELSYYKTRHGYIVRRKGGPTRERMLKDPAFQRARENGKEFGACARAGKHLRQTFLPLIKRASDEMLVSRVNKLMFAIKNLDTVSARGERNVGKGIMQGKTLLKGFDFNADARLRSILLKSAVTDKITGTITLNNLVPSKDLVYPNGANRVRLRAGWARIDFENMGRELCVSNEVIMAINDTAQTVILSPNDIPTHTGTDIFVLRIDFLQELNGVVYALKNEKYSAAGIVEVVNSL